MTALLLTGAVSAPDHDPLGDGSQPDGAAQLHAGQAPGEERRPSYCGQDVAPGGRQHQQVPQSHRPHPHLHHDRGPQVQPEELSLHPRRHPDEARVQERYRREISEEDRGDHPETSEDGGGREEHKVSVLHQ